MTNLRLPLSVRIAVFLTTFSGLVFEIGLTRIYSATIWYHFAFVAISIALLGWGLGGMAAHVWRRFHPAATGHAAIAALLYGLSLPVCLWILGRSLLDLLDTLTLFAVPVKQALNHLLGLRRIGGVQNVLKMRSESCIFEKAYYIRRNSIAECLWARLRQPFKIVRR